MPKAEVKPSKQSPAIGYIRLDDDANDAVFALLLKDVAACCQWHRLRLIRTFTDRGYDGSQLARPGIVELREALKEHPGAAVVVPTLDHLSPAETIRTALVQLISNLGGRLVMASDADALNGVSIYAQDAANPDEDGS